MLRKLALLIALGLLAGSAQAATPPAKPAPAKPAAAKPAAPATPKAPPFDARDPASLIAVLAAMEAKAEVAKAQNGEVFLKVSTPTFGFSAEYVGCNGANKGCAAVGFSTLTDKKTATLAQINAFNQTSITCRVFQDQQGKPHVMYATLLSPNLEREDLRIHVGVWQGCLASFGEFLRDPPGYLATAP